MLPCFALITCGLHCATASTVALTLLLLCCSCSCRSHKGSNLALMVELLAGPLVGAAVADKLEQRNWGNLLLAVDPELLGDAESIRARTQVGSWFSGRGEGCWLLTLLLAVDLMFLAPTCAYRPCFSRAVLQVVLDRVKGAERLPGVDEILLPSERGNRVAAQRASSGMVPIEANLYHNLKVCCMCELCKQWWRKFAFGMCGSDLEFVGLDVARK